MQTDTSVDQPPRLHEENDRVESEGGNSEIDNEIDTPQAEDDKIEQQFAEKIKLKGCSFHDNFQKAHKKCQRKLAAREELELRLFFEPVNLRDDNAIVVQAKLEETWQSLGYVPSKKVPKVTVAFQSNIIHSVNLVKVYRQLMNTDILVMQLLSKQVDGILMQRPTPTMTYLPNSWHN